MVGRQSFLIAALAALAAVLFAPSAALAEGHAQGAPKVVYRHQTMGTIVGLTLLAGDEEKTARLAKAVFAELDRVDELMSSWRKGSDVARINESPGRWVVIDREVFRVIQAAQAMSRKTGGAFDITVGSYRGLWKFDQDLDGTIPDAADVEARRHLVNYRDVKLNPRRHAVKLSRKGQRITLGGVAKGYSVDRAIALLRERGVENFIIQAGGDLYASGMKPDGYWTVGIRDPRGARNESFAVTQIKDKTFSTSGDYERSVIVDGVRYHHILDPATGRPATRSRSVTVMTDSAMSADMWSTSLFVLGPEKGRRLVDRTPGVEAVFVGADNKVTASKGLSLVPIGTPLKLGRVVLLKQPTNGI